MIYRLYANIGGLKEIDRCSDEGEIIKDISDCIKGNTQISFIIILETKDQDIPYKTINNMGEFEKYVEQYEQVQKEIAKIKKLK